MDIEDSLSSDSAPEDPPVLRTRDTEKKSIQEKEEEKEASVLMMMARRKSRMKIFSEKRMINLKKSTRKWRENWKKEIRK